jgi:hypothetical protein
MWLSEAVRIAAEEGGEQWRQGRSSAGPSTSQSPSQTSSAASRFLFKLNRQIPELEAPLSLRKQRSANHSNRQNSSSLATSHLLALLALLALAQEGTKEGLLVTRISNRELTMRVVCAPDGPAERGASASRANSVMRGICLALSNREPLELETLQLAENKHRHPVLIANFEPIHRAGFRAFVAAAFRRATFLFQSSGHPRESAQREGLSK